MAHHKSALKRIRKSQKQRTYNVFYRKRLKAATREVMESSNRQEAEEKLKAAYSLLDRLAQKKVLHRNNVAHRKSRLSKHVKQLS